MYHRTADAVCRPRCGVYPAFRAGARAQAVRSCAVENGQYEVSVSVGDAACPIRDGTVYVNGVELCKGVQVGQEDFKKFTAQVGRHRRPADHVQPPEGRPLRADENQLHRVSEETGPA